MSWASRRTTTRIEDSAYALLGIFDINMPLLYGEGPRAFIRLQQEIMKKTNDHSIFVWGLEPTLGHYLQPAPEIGAMRTQTGLVSSHLLARSPMDFKNCGNIEKAGVSTVAFTASNAGLEIELPLIPLFSTGSPHYPDTLIGSIALLNCTRSGSSELIGIFLCSTAGSNKGVGDVHRAQLAFHTPLHTVPIGLGLATQSETRKLTIVDSGDEGHQSVGLFASPRALRVAVSETQSFQTMQYHISYAIPLSNQSNWDPETKLLTKMNNDIVPNELCCFKFRQPHTDGIHDFTLFLRTNSGNVALFKSLDYPKSGWDSIFDSLGIQGKHVGEQCTTVSTSGDKFEIVASITHNIVFGVRIYQVCLDAAPLHLSGSFLNVLEDTEMQFPPRPPHRLSNRALRDGMS